MQKLLYVTPHLSTGGAPQYLLRKLELLLNDYDIQLEKYIEETLKNLKVKISKLAQGLPVGGEIESLDDGTLFSAFRNRTQI